MREDQIYLLEKDSFIKVLSLNKGKQTSNIKMSMGEKSLEIKKIMMDKFGKIGAFDGDFLYLLNNKNNKVD